MQKLIISVPAPLYNKIKEAVELGGFASRAELFRQAISRFLEDRDKAWDLQRMRRDEFLKQQPYLAKLTHESKNQV